MTEKPTPLSCGHLPKWGEGIAKHKNNGIKTKTCYKTICFVSLPIWGDLEGQKQS